MDEGRVDEGSREHSDARKIYYVRIELFSISLQPCLSEHLILQMPPKLSNDREGYPSLLPLSI
jgi:hypothetical protein